MTTLRPGATTARIGITLLSADFAIRPDDLAREAEARGFESLWLPEHSNIPISRESPWPGSLDGAPLPPEYSHLHDALVALSMAAAVTTELRLGTSVLLLAQRDAVWTAKQLATLDYLSGGRVEVGVGVGWNREEMANHGCDFPSRWERTREVAEAMRRLWTDEVAAYQGNQVTVAPTWQWPKPSQPGGPAIHIGGGIGPRLMGEVATWGDGWLPISARTSLASRLQVLHEACERVERDPLSLHISVFGATTDADGLTNLFSEGITRAVLTLPSADREVVLPLLDQWANVREKVAARVGG
jgi:probable F420-dependent oxidoreductase